MDLRRVQEGSWHGRGDLATATITKYFQVEVTNKPTKSFNHFLTQIVAHSLFWVQARTMRKTSDIIWQDAQHQVLFEILDLIKQPEADRQVLCRLEDYTRYHFELEEQYMARLEYPGTDAHIRAHDRFRQEITQLVSGSQPLDDRFREIIATFLTEWLTRHVFGIDKKLEDFILQSDLK